MYKVMIADDEPMVRKGLANLVDWHEIGCEVVYMGNDGLDLINNIPKFDPDIIISDIKMPEVDGIGVAKYVYENRLKAKVILLTAYADFSYAKSAIKYDVVEYVIKTGALENIINAVEKCKKLIERERTSMAKSDIKAMEINFLKSIIDSSLFRPDKINSVADEYKIALGHYIVLSLKFEPNRKLIDTEEGKMYNGMSNFFSMEFNDLNSYIVPLRKNLFCIIIYNIYDGHLDKIHNICNDIVDTVKTFMKMRVFIGISEPAQGILNLNKAFSQSMDALKQRFLHEDMEIYYYAPQPKVNRAYSSESYRLVEKVCTEIGKGATEKALEYLHQLFTLYKDNDFTEDSIKKDGLIIKNRCEELLSYYDTTIAELYEHDNESFTNILGVNLFSEYQAAVTRMITKTSQSIYRAAKLGNNIIVETLRYIDDNYFRNITLNNIASHVNVNSSYLSRIFKERTGNTITDTINNKKIEKAKEYLLGTNMLIWEISQSIGIEDATYFSHLFKKYTGLSPSQYKNSYRNS